MTTYRGLKQRLIVRTPRYASLLSSLNSGLLGGSQRKQLKGEGRGHSLAWSRAINQLKSAFPLKFKRAESTTYEGYTGPLPLDRQ